MPSIRTIFSGRVQGVGFRYEVKQLALGFDLVGTIKNLEDGSVCLEIMGERPEIEEFLAEITQESVLAPLIKDFRSLEIPPLQESSGFSITD